MNEKNLFAVAGYVAVGMLTGDIIDYVTKSNYVAAIAPLIIALGVFYIAHKERIQDNKRIYRDGFIDGTTDAVTKILKSLDIVTKEDKKNG